MDSYETYNFFINTFNILTHGQETYNFFINTAMKHKTSSLIHVTY